MRLLHKANAKKVEDQQIKYILEERRKISEANADEIKRLNLVRDKHDVMMSDLEASYRKRHKEIQRDINLIENDLATLRAEAKVCDNKIKLVKDKVPERELEKRRKEELELIESVTRQRELLADLEEQKEDLGYELHDRYMELDEIGAAYAEQQQMAEAQVANASDLLNEYTKKLEKGKADHIRRHNELTDRETGLNEREATLEARSKRQDDMQEKLDKQLKKVQSQKQALKIAFDEARKKGIL